MCSRSVSKGDRTWFTCHAHFWPAFENGKISRDDLGVARPLERSSSDEDFFFLREPEGRRRKQEGLMRIHSVRNRSFVDLHFHIHTSFFCLSFVIPHLGLRKHVYGPPACVKVYSQLLERAYPFVEKVYTPPLANETSCRYEALFQINSSGPLVQA